MPLKSKSLIWVIKLQWQVSAGYFIWNGLNNLFRGLYPLATAYISAQLLNLLAQVALQTHQVAAATVYKWLIWLTVLVIIRQLMSTLNWHLLQVFQHKMDLVVGQILVKKGYSLSQQQFDDPDFNTKFERAQVSINSLWAVNEHLSHGAATLIGLSGALITISLHVPWVGLVVMISLLPEIWLRMRVNNSSEQAYRRAAPRSRLASHSRWALLDPKQMAEIRLMVAFKKLLKLWRTHQAQANKIIDHNNRRLLKWQLPISLVEPLTNFGANFYLIALVFSRGLGLDNFLFLRQVLAETFNQATQLEEAFRRFHSFSIDLDNFNQVYTTKPAIPNGKIEVKAPLQITFDKVSFSYPGSNKVVLKDISLEIKAGQRLALVGENAAGKTTIIKLLLRQYLPSKGVIRVNGHDLRQLEIDTFYNQLGCLSQTPLLFEHLTIEDNLAIGCSHKPTKAQVYRATDLVESTDFIKDLPHRLESRLHAAFEDGTDLSGGQRQRLAIARTLLQSKDLLVLDEPTSMIDAKGEQTIFNNVYQLHDQQTTLIISHRLSSVRRADKIIVLAKGEIVESGTHKQLMAQTGLYQNMFEIQAKGYA